MAKRLIRKNWRSGRRDTGLRKWMRATGIDAYVQYDEGESDYIAKSFRVRMCAECFKENYESLTETKAENNNQSGTPTAEEKGN